MTLEEQDIVDRYYLLRNAYFVEFGPKSVSTHERGDRYHVEAGVPQLLPSWNGWTYSPLDSAPRPIADSFTAVEKEMADCFRFLWVVMEDAGIYRCGEMICENGDCKWLSGDNWREQYIRLDSLEKQIKERAQVHSVFHRSEEIFAHAIPVAQADLDGALQETSSNIIPELSKVCGPVTFTYRTVPVPTTSVQHQRLLRLRLRWLKDWHAVETRRFETIKRNEDMNIQPNNWIRLVQPRELFKAFQILDTFLPLARVDNYADHSVTNFWNRMQANNLDPFFALGEWYRMVLWRCGASVSELEAMVSKCSWRDLAAKKYRYWERKAPNHTGCD